jgi:hypothetical protein
MRYAAQNNKKKSNDFQSGLKHTFFHGAKHPTLAFTCGARSAFQAEGKKLLEKHAIAPSAASLCWAPPQKTSMQTSSSFEARVLFFEMFVSTIHFFQRSIVLSRTTIRPIEIFLKLLAPCERLSKFRFCICQNGDLLLEGSVLYAASGLHLPPRRPDLWPDPSVFECRS